MTQEPTVLNCLRVVNSTCLAQGIRCKIKGQAVTNAFQKFLNLHYLPFCENAIRCMFTCGFVPWRIRRLCHGDSTPEVLPLGTFAWAVQSSHSRSVQRGTALACKRPAKVPRGPTGGSPHSVFDRQQRALSRQPLPQNDNDSRALRYVVHLTEPLGFESDDVEIYETVQPTHNVSQSSVLLPTITSPMAHIIVDYLILRQAQVCKAPAPEPPPCLAPWLTTPARRGGTPTRTPGTPRPRSSARTRPRRTRTPSTRGTPSSTTSGSPRRTAWAS